ncbi:c-type cytochrome [Deinococcus aestuarii]|uniref:c-type cytochrome n=1 Tax=Deinococcus aestuarii TaxID=2774531 RepID=UPI001C0D9F42|nr:cytochrome c [Deinococcus aestuarii]
MNKVAYPLTVALAGLTLAAAPTTPAYTKAQATAGAKVYAAQCAACHGTTLSNGGAPKLAGPDFLKKWSKNTLDDYYFIESTTMPQTHPGSLKEAEYLNVLAYVLQQNGFKAGTKPLAAADLKTYTFQK